MESQNSNSLLTSPNNSSDLALTPRTLAKTLHSSEKDLFKLKKVFSAFDLNGDGCITKQELKTVLKNIGKPLTDSETAHIMESLDLDKNGSISFVEFLRGYSQLEELTGTLPINAMNSESLSKETVVPTTPHKPKEVRKYTPAELETIKEIFTNYDKDGDGSVSLQDLKTAFTKDFNKNVSNAEIEHMFLELDTDGDGKMSFVEFLRGYAVIEQLSGVFPAEKLRKPQRTRRGSVGSWSMPRRFTPEELSHFHEVFDSNCRVKGQLVVPQEFKAAIDKLGRSMTATQLGTVMKELNLKDGDTLNFVDFVKSIDRLDATTYTTEEKELIKQIFKQIDSKGLGRINKKQIIQFLEHLKTYMSSDVSDFEIQPMLNQLSPEALLSTFEGFDEDVELSVTDFSSAFLTLDKATSSIILRKFANMSTAITYPLLISSVNDQEPNSYRMSKMASMPVMPVSRRGSVTGSTMSPIARAAMVSAATPPLSPKSQNVTPRSPLSARSTLIEEEEEAHMILFDSYDKGDGLLNVPLLRQLVKAELLQDTTIPESEVDLLLELCFDIDLERNPTVRKKAFLEGYPKLVKSIQKKKKLMLQVSGGSSSSAQTPPENRPTGSLPAYPPPESSKPSPPVLSLPQRFQWPEKQKEESYSEWKQQHPDPPHKMSAEFLKKFLPEPSNDPPPLKKKGSSNASSNQNPPTAIVTLATLKGSSPSPTRKLSTQEKIQKLKTEWEKDRIKRQAEENDTDLIPTEAMPRSRSSSRGSPARSRRNSGLRRIQVITVPQETLLAKEQARSREASPRVSNSPPKPIESPPPPILPATQYESDKDTIIITRSRSNSQVSNDSSSSIAIPKLKLDVLTSDSDSAKPKPVAVPKEESSSSSSDRSTDSSESDRDQKFAELRKQLQALDSQLSFQQQQVEQKQRQQEELLSHLTPIEDIQRKIEAIMAQLNLSDNDSETTKRLEEKLRDLQQQASEHENSKPEVPVIQKPIEEQIYEKKMQQYHPNTRQDSSNKLAPPKQNRPILSPKRSLSQLPTQPKQNQALSSKERQHLQQQMILQRQKRLLEEKKLHEQLQASKVQTARRAPPEKKEHLHIPPQHFIAVRSEQAKADMEKHKQKQVSPKRNFLSVEEVERRHKLRQQENVQRARERERLRMSQRLAVQKKLEAEMKRQFEENMQKQEMERKKREVALRKLLKAEEDKIQRHKEQERSERIRRRQMEQEEDEKVKKFREKSRTKLKEIEQQLKDHMSNKEIYKGFIKDVNNQLEQLKLKHDKFVEEHNLTKEQKRARAIATVERLYSLAKIPESKDEEKPKKKKKKKASLQKQKKVWEENEMKRKRMREMTNTMKEQRKAYEMKKEEEKKKQKLTSKFRIPEDNKTAALHEENKKRINKRLGRMHEYELSLWELQRLLEAASEGDADSYAKLEELGIFEESLLRLSVQDLGRESASFIRDYIKSEWDGTPLTPQHTTTYFQQPEGDDQHNNMNDSYEYIATHETPQQHEEEYLSDGSDSQSDNQELDDSMEGVDNHEEDEHQFQLERNFAQYFNVPNVSEETMDYNDQNLEELNIELDEDAQDGEDDLDDQEQDMEEIDHDLHQDEYEQPDQDGFSEDELNDDEHTGETYQDEDDPQEYDQDDNTEQPLYDNDPNDSMEYPDQDGSSDFSEQDYEEEDSD